MQWKKVIILFVVLLAVGGGLVTYLWYQARQAGGLSVEIVAPDNVEIGVPFTATIAVSNAGSGVAQETTLALSLPDGFIFMSEPATKRVSTKSLGSLGKGTATTQEFRIMPVSNENSIVQLRASLSYVPTDLGSRFEKQTEKEMQIGESGISLDIIAPTKVFAGETFEVKIDYENISETEFYDLELVVEYPRGFTFLSSTLPPDDENIWKLGDLRAGSKGSFTIKGGMQGPDNAFFDFSVGVNTSFLGKSYAVNQKTASISIAPSALAVTVVANNGAEFVAAPGDIVEYEITYKNNTSIGLKDVIIIAKLIGEMFDLRELEPREGVFRSSDNSIMWNASRVPSLSVLSPGEEGVLAFSVKVRSSYPIQRISDKNFVLKIAAQIESPTVPANVASQRTVGSTSHEAKVRGLLVPLISAYYADDSSITNSGPIPLRVGQATTFNMHWTLKNQATDMESVKLKTFLGPNVRYTGAYTATNSIAPTYNERTQEFIWEPGTIPATKGVIDNPVELTFQVEITPSSNQVNQYPALTGETTISAKDAFTGHSFFDRQEAFTTILINDPSLVAKDKVVQF